MTWWCVGVSGAFGCGAWVWYPVAPVAGLASSSGMRIKLPVATALVKVALTFGLRQRWRLARPSPLLAAFRAVLQVWPSFDKVLLTAMCGVSRRACPGLRSGCRAVFLAQIPRPVQRWLPRCDARTCGWPHDFHPVRRTAFHNHPTPI